MFRTPLFLLFCLIGFSGALSAQPGKKGLRTRTLRPIEEAQRVRLQEPERAIEILSAVIESKRAEAERMQAYLILGDIYGDISQHDLALERYRTALDLLPEGEASAFAPTVYQRLGEAYTRLGNLPEANRAFSNCLDLAPAESAQQLTCQTAISTLGDRESAEYTTENSLADTLSEPLQLDRLTNILRGQNSIDLKVKDLDAAAAKADYQQRQLRLQRWLIYLLGALLLLAVASVAVILRNVRKRRRANQDLLLRNLQTRMNPHFIFNSLNSINNYIAREDDRSANRYLGRFARLMRRVLDQSGKDLVPLSEELEQLDLYLGLEKERFGVQFDYSLTVDPGVDTEQIAIPPMLLQPYVENAIWHGLRYREAGGEVTVTVFGTAEAPRVVIEDNGIGRERSARLKTDNQLRHDSKGLDITAQRIDLINRRFDRAISVMISDARPGAEYPGTRVTLQLS